MMVEDEKKKNSASQPEESKEKKSQLPDEPTAKKAADPKEEASTEKTQSADTDATPSPKKILILPGSDPELTQTLVTFLESLNCQPVLPDVRKNVQNSLIQKSLDHPDLSFVIAILSADNFVYPRNDKPHNASLRAHQRTVFEFGFWIGKLGRDRVVALYYDQRSFRVPGEFFDAIYIPYNQKRIWQRELKARLEQVEEPSPPIDPAAEKSS